ncbi:MAG: hypothetical protein ACI3YM_07790 [Prevotella sp.]
MPDNNKPKDDALRQVMRRRKERRPKMELPKEVEDRVMERICISSTKPDTPSAANTKVVRLWILRSLSAAAAIAGILVLAETMIPESHKDVEPALEAKIEVYRPQEHVAEHERPAVVAADEPAATHRKLHSPKVRKTTVRQLPDESDAEVCINCELDAMADELTAMINEFENQ